MIPNHLLDSFSRARDRHSGRGDCRVALIVRHAERFPVTDLMTHEEAVLTEHGHAQALAAGRRLAEMSVQSAHLAHSPVPRCGETAKGIAAGILEGGARADLVGAIEALAAPFVVDRARSYGKVMEMGHTFVRAWFDGEISPELFVPRREAARGQLKAILGEAGICKAEDVCILVTHDWNIALIREEFLGLTHEKGGWPGYLDGVVVSVEDGVATVEAHGRRGAVDLERNDD
jgi:broad specificity phosphatase PhoE